MANVLHRLGLFTARYKWLVIAAWIVGAVFLIFAFRTAGSNTNNNLDLPGTDSQAATDLLAKRFPPQQNGSNPLVFHTTTGKVTDSQRKQAIEASYKEVVKLPHVAGAVSPFSQQGAAQISKDKKTAFIPVLLDVGGSQLTEDIAESVLDAGNPGEQAGMEVAVGGSVGGELSEPKTESSEVVGLLAAMVILAFTFGTLVAMGLPIISGVIGLLCGLSLIGLLGHLVSVPTIAPTLATMIGLGVGIDYALFLVSRHRTQRREGMELHESIALAVATSGSAIVFAGTTVVIALLTLLVAGIPLVTSLGYASAFAVVTAVLAAVTLLPAVLAAVGPHIDSVHVPSFLRPKTKDLEHGFWGAWARRVTERPWQAVGLSILILIPLIIPFFSLNLGQEDIGATPKSTTERQAFDLMSSGFGPGYNGPLLIATQLGKPAAPSSEFLSQKQQAQGLQSQLEKEQKQGKSQQQQLNEQANKLTAQENQLEQQQNQLEQQQGTLAAEQQALTAQSAEVTREQQQLQATANAITKQQSGLTKQIGATGKEARQVVSEGAKVTKKLTRTVAKLGKNRAQQRATVARLERAKTARERARLTAKLKALQREQQGLETQVEKLVKQEQALRKQTNEVLATAHTLRVQEVNLANRAVELGKDATALAKQAATIVQQKQALVTNAYKLQVQAADLQTQAANLQTQAANLNTQKVELQGQQQQAQTQQQQAEQLQTELTNELTKAGGDERGTDPRLVNLQDALSATQGVDVVSPPRINKSGDAVVYSVIATTRPAAPETADLVRTLRNYVIPQAIQGTDVTAYVGGQTASYVDLANAISSRLFLVIIVVIGLSFCVLLAAFRSLLFSVQAAIANVLSVSAAFGVLTACFQWGWGINLIGVETSIGSDPIASYVPLMMFAVVFGLSMDYQVFLISQIEQHRAGAEDDRSAVRHGLTAGARVIVAAALIMTAVFASFILNGDPTVKQFGVGLAVGVVLAAMTVLLFAPAMLVLGDRGSWWVPVWLDRILPHMDVEGARLRSRPEAEPRPVEAPPEPLHP